MMSDVRAELTRGVSRLVHFGGIRGLIAFSEASDVVRNK